MNRQYFTLKGAGDSTYSIHLSAQVLSQNGPIRDHRPSAAEGLNVSHDQQFVSRCFLVSRPLEEPEGEEDCGSLICFCFVFYHFRTTGPGCPPSVVPWVLVHLSWGLVPVLQDPSRLVHHDREDRNPRPPAEEGDLQGGSRDRCGGGGGGKRIFNRP